MVEYIKVYKKLYILCLHLRHNKLPGEQANGREGTVSKEWERSEGIDRCVHIRKPFEPLKITPFVTIPTWTMSTEKDFN